MNASLFFFFGGKEWNSIKRVFLSFLILLEPNPRPIRRTNEETKATGEYWFQGFFQKKVISFRLAECAQKQFIFSARIFAYSHFSSPSFIFVYYFFFFCFLRHYSKMACFKSFLTFFGYLVNFLSFSLSVYHFTQPLSLILVFSFNQFLCFYFFFVCLKFYKWFYFSQKLLT